jgi:Peptidase family S41/N-terminal domain of Peptidase_S41 in eukaryotic IRBP
VDRTEVSRLEREINSEVRTRFDAGAVRRVAVIQHDDDPAIEPGELLVRVFVGTADEPADHQRALDEWAQAHQAGMRRMRRELSLRLPEARLLEFTVDAPGTDARITMPDDPALTSERLPPRETVESALALLRRSYVFPDRAERAAVAIEARLAAGEYDGLEEDALAELLTSQIQEICDDKHLRVRTMPPRPARVPDGPAAHGPGRPAGPGPGRGDRRPLNYGIFRAERLDGNVGYLDVRGVPGPEEAGRVIAAAMELISGTYALIIDLRRNHGGSPHAVVLWCSYFFADGSTHLNDIFDADTGETRQFWSLAYLPGSRYLERPVYVLTSSETFSGGEDFAYTLQAQGRAEVIGAASGGGAHPTRMIPISATIAIGVPHARSVNPVTGTNWQGTGVIPDISVPATDAYDVAYRRALEHVLSTTVPPPVAAEARDALAALPAAEQSGAEPA